MSSEETPFNRENFDARDRGEETPHHEVTAVIAREELAVSVVVPTRDRPALLEHTLESLLWQDYPRARYEILVVDDCSLTPVRVPAGVRLFRHQQASGPNAARNTGAREARHDLLCFVDDDIEAPPDWLRELATGAGRNPNAWCLGGPIRLRLEDVSLRGCSYCKRQTGETELELGEEERVSSDYMFGANFAVRKRALREAGDFDESRPIYFEELEWQDRVRAAGGEIVYLPAAWLWHRRTRDSMRFRARLLRRFRGGRGYAIYRREQGLRVGSRGDFFRPLAHAVHHRCPIGLLNAATEAGKLTGTVEYARSRLGSRVRRRRGGAVSPTKARK
jgi:GT2 family glycosyltransferase